MDTLLTVGGAFLSVAVAIIMIYELPGLFSLIGLRKLAMWSERQTSRLPILPGLLDRFYK
jgi:hypothetical protein